MFKYLNSIPDGLPGVWYPFPPLAPWFGGNICKFASGTAVKEQGKRKQKRSRSDFTSLKYLNQLKQNWSQNLLPSWVEMLLCSLTTACTQIKSHEGKKTRNHTAFYMRQQIVIKGHNSRSFFFLLRSYSQIKSMLLFQPSNKHNINKISTSILINNI